MWEQGCGKAGDGAGTPHSHRHSVTMAHTRQINESIKLVWRTTISTLINVALLQVRVCGHSVCVYVYVYVCMCMCVCACKVCGTVTVSCARCQKRLLLNAPLYPRSHRFFSATECNCRCLLGERVSVKSRSVVMGECIHVFV